MLTEEKLREWERLWKAATDRDSRAGGQMGALERLTDILMAFPQLIAEVWRLQAAVAEEREAAAQVAENEGRAIAAGERDCIPNSWNACLRVAAAIRARGDTHA